MMRCQNPSCKWTGDLTPERTGLDQNNRPVCGLCQRLAVKSEGLPVADGKLFPFAPADVPVKYESARLDPLAPDDPVDDFDEEDTGDIEEDEDREDSETVERHG